METNKKHVIDINKCIHPRETSRFILAVLIVIPVITLFIVLTVGFGLLIVPVILFISWFVVMVFKAYLLGNCVEVTPNNFSQVHGLVKDICDDLNYYKKVEVYIYHSGEVNSFLIKRFNINIIFLPHELIAGTLDKNNQTQLMYILSRSIGHLKAKHMRFWWLNLLISSFEKLAFLNLFLYPWERATQYSGDRIGLAVCSDLKSAVIAMNKLMLGNNLSETTTLVGALEQQSKLKGTFFGWIAEAFSKHPHMTNRIESLISWSKSYDKDIYEEFMESQSNRIDIELFLGSSGNRRSGSDWRVSSASLSIGDYVPLNEFSKYKSIDKEKIIQMIRDGFYNGRIIEEKWYVHKSELEKNKA